MADQSTQQSSGGNSGLAFIVGALVVAVGVLAYVMFGGGVATDGGENFTISIEGAAPASDQSGGSASSGGESGN